MKTPDEILKVFYEQRASEEPATDREAQLRFRKTLKLADLSAGETVLDIGAKWGGLGVLARDIGIVAHYIGVELTESHVEKGRALGLDLRLGDASGPLPVGDGEVDCIICLEVLEHLLSPIAVLLEMRRVIRPSGRVVISVPNPYSWVEVYRELFKKPDPEGHVVGFTLPVIENVLALAGFRIERRGGTSLRIPMTRRLLPTNSILARSRLYVARPSPQVRFSGWSITLDPS